MPVTEDTRDTALLLRRLGRALHRLERDRICCGSITRQQFETLRQVQEAGSLTTSEIASRLGIDLSTASRNLAVLERERCLARRTAAEDARRVRHAVTARGRACLEELCCEERDTLCAALDELPRGGRSAVLHALSLLAPALERAASCECTASCPPPKRTRPKSAPPAGHAGTKRASGPGARAGSSSSPGSAANRRRTEISP